MSSKIFVRIHPVIMMLWTKMCQSPMGPIAHVPHCPCGPLPMWPIPCPYPLYPIPLYPLWPIARGLHTPCTPYPLWALLAMWHFAPVGLIAHVPYTPLPPVSSLPLGPIAHVTHTPVPHCPHYPCSRLPNGGQE